MSDGSPNAVGLMVDSQDTNRHPGASGRTASFRVTAQTIDAAIQSHKNPCGVHHTHGSHIPVTYRVSAQRLFIRVFTGLLDGGGDTNMFTITAIDPENLDQNALPGLSSLSGM